MTRTRKPSAAMIVALVALFVALSGTAVAGSGLITGKQIKDHSIGLVDLSAKAVAKLHGARGAPGPQGTAGPAGAQGPQGAPGTPGANGTNGLNGGFDPKKLTLVQGSSYSVLPDDTVTADTYCPATHPTPIFAGVGSYTGQISSLIIYPGLSLARIRVSNFVYTYTITFTPYIVCAAS